MVIMDFKANRPFRNKTPLNADKVLNIFLNSYEIVFFKFCIGISEIQYYGLHIECSILVFS